MLGLRGYDNWKLSDPHGEEDACICAGLSEKACPVHDPEWFDEEGNELPFPRNLDDEKED